MNCYFMWILWFEVGGSKSLCVVFMYEYSVLDSNSVTFFMEIPEMAAAKLSMIPNSRGKLQPFLCKTWMVGFVWTLHDFY